MADAPKIMTRCHNADANVDANADANVDANADAMLCNDIQRNAKKGGMIYNVMQKRKCNAMRGDKLAANPNSRKKKGAPDKANVLAVQAVGAAGLKRKD